MASETPPRDDVHTHPLGLDGAGHGAFRALLESIELGQTRRGVATAGAAV